MLHGTSRNEARYGELGRVLPELVPDCERSAWSGRHAAGFRLVAELYHAAAATMAELGDADAAWVAADRSAVAATHAGDVVPTGGSEQLPSRPRVPQCRAA